ncbi:FUSC family protein [Paraburkholderia bannensis]|uniref:FUSC family protein n=1 Tax=Paraburkholderia bannensis TaxID=765414 RepID=UPI002ABE0FBA|nr:FUSC family protein [Paraburkholderia bannensis]
MTSQYDSPRTRPAFPLFYEQFLDNLRTWLKADGEAWLFAFKAALAAILAVGISMRLELPQPRTAMVTVFIVMRPHTGLVLARGFYRLCGTLVGVIAAMTLIALFGQFSDVFILLTALWIAVCTTGAARNRNSRSYGFVLAGYTAALIGVPALQDPNTAFMLASTRVAELSLGIICAGVVSALVFPAYAGDEIQTALRAQSSSFLSYVARTLPSRKSVDDVVAMHEHLISSLVNFESLRVIAVLETHAMKSRSQRMRRLSSELMAASTRFHALLHFRNQLRLAGDHATIKTLNSCVAGFGRLLIRAPQALDTYESAAKAVERLDRCRRRVKQRLVHAVPVAAASTMSSLNLATAVDQLERFGSELSAYVHTYASLRDDTHKREDWLEPLAPKTDLLVAVAAGVRAAAATIALGFFWIATAWPSGATAVAQGAAICALSSTAANPFRLAIQIAGGTLIGGIAGTILVFGVYPHIDGFPLLALAIAVATIPGAFIMTRPKIAGYGIGYCVFMPALAGPDNPQAYVPEAFLNDAIALVIAMLVAAAAQALVIPATSIWFRLRITARLKKEVSFAFYGPLSGLRTAFESGVRDLMAQQLMLPRRHDFPIASAMSWLNSVLEIGSAIIDFREASEGATYVECSQATKNARSALTTTVKLFEHANPALRHAAFDAVIESMAELQRAARDVANRADDANRFKMMLKAMNLIKHSLRDPNTALGQTGSPPSRRSVIHYRRVPSRSRRKSTLRAHVRPL